MPHRQADGARQDSTKFSPLSQKISKTQNEESEEIVVNGDLPFFSHVAHPNFFTIPDYSYPRHVLPGQTLDISKSFRRNVASKRVPGHLKALRDFRQDQIHPATLRVGLQMSRRKICGTNARTVAMLTAFQRFIEDYSPPAYQAIDKHMKIMLDRQINFITHCRPHSLAMGGTIRWLKRKLSGYANLPLDKVRTCLISDISNFIHQRIAAATWTISNIVQEQLIENGDRLMVFGHSTAVSLAILQAKRHGLKFSVIVVDSQHSTAGYESAKQFFDAGIEVAFTPLNGLSYHIRDITKVLLGAACLLANAYVMNRAGGATVAMMGYSHAKPVLVVCETYKMSDRVLLDSCTFNELGEPGLVWNSATTREEKASYSNRVSFESDAFLQSLSIQENVLTQSLQGDIIDSEDTEETVHATRFVTQSSTIKSNVARIPVINPCYDVTPSDFIDYVVTEDGIYPASNIPSIIRGYGKSPAIGT